MWKSTLHHGKFDWQVLESEPKLVLVGNDLFSLLKLCPLEASRRLECKKQTFYRSQFEIGRSDLYLRRLLRMSWLGRGRAGRHRELEVSGEFSQKSNSIVLEMASQALVPLQSLPILKLLLLVLFHPSVRSNNPNRQ